jgi:predicted dehydrogenase
MPRPFPSGLASLAFNGCSRHSPAETCTIVGSLGTLRASGGICSPARVEVATVDGTAHAYLVGSWFPDGFRGTMGELLCSIEENREPQNSAADILKSLSICLGAMKSADEDRPIALGSYPSPQDVTLHGVQCCERFPRFRHRDFMYCFPSFLQHRTLPNPS